MIFLVFSLVIGVSLLLAIKDFIPDLVAGIRLSKKDLINNGDTIELSNLNGTIRKADLTHIEIVTDENDIIFFPNSKLIKQKFKIIKKATGDQDSPVKEP